MTRTLFAVKISTPKSKIPHFIGHAEGGTNGAKRTRVVWEQARLFNRKQDAVASLKCWDAATQKRAAIVEITATLP